VFSRIEDFLNDLEVLKDELLPDATIEIVYKRIDAVSLRLWITNALFIDVYANTETKRYDFSLIRENKRIFGFDNLGGWHYHPLDKLEDHIKCKEPSLLNMFKETTKVIKLEKTV